jgi:hypothetical protein
MIFLVKALRMKEKQEDLAKAYEKYILSGTKIDYSEIIRGKLVAIDLRNRKLVCLDGASGKGNTSIDLERVSSTNISEVRNEKGLIKKIALQLEIENGSAYTISFFDDAKDPLKEVNTSLRKAGWWKRRIDRAKTSKNEAWQMEYVL